MVVARVPHAAAAQGASISRTSFDFLRYASVWEDADVLCEALRPVACDGRILSVASAGDNALALLTLDPAAVVAADLSSPQLAALELRVVAFRRLERDRLLGFLGTRPAQDRATTYRGLRPELSPPAQHFWDLNPDAIRIGPIHAGKFERYFNGFRRFVLPLIHSRREVTELLRAVERPERHRFYDEVWDTRRWRTLFRIFFGRAVMGAMGRDPEFFAHVEGSVGDRILERTRYALTALDTASNPYLTYILTGNWGEHALPRYLRAEYHDAIRSRLDRLSWQHAAIQHVPGDFDGFNLSDVFEYMSLAEHAATYAALVGRARPGSRLVYWNMLAPRGIPDALKGRVMPHDALAAELHARAHAWFYSALHIDEVGPS